MMVPGVVRMSVVCIAVALLSSFTYYRGIVAPELSQPASFADPQKAKAVLREELSIGVENGDPHYIFARPTNVVVDGKGDIYVIEMFDKTIRKYNKSGKYLGNIGRSGEGPGEFKMPTFAAIDPKDNFYVFDFTTMRISVFRPDGKFERSFVPGFLAGGLVVTPKGEIVVCGLKDGKLMHQYDSNGKLLSSLGDGSEFSSDPRMGGFNFPFVYLGPDTSIYMCLVPKPTEVLKCVLSSKTLTNIARNAPDHPKLTMKGNQPSGSMTRGMVVLKDGTIVVCVSVPGSGSKGEPVEQLDFYSKEGSYLVSSKEFQGRPRFVDRDGGMYVVANEPFPRVVKYSVRIER